MNTPEHKEIQLEFQKTSELNRLLKLTDSLSNQIQQLKEKHPDFWSTILSKLKTDWTYHSNSIEGSSLSRGDTHFFLLKG